jgi:hypothetical protein
MSFERGEIKYKSRAAQFNNFSKLKRMRNITPTDIDGFLDYGGRFFIFLEGKSEGRELEKGQRMALENLVKGLARGKSPAIAIVYEHNIDPPNEVWAESCNVREVFCLFNGNFVWRKYEKGKYDVLEVVEFFENKYNIT